ncbi:hypothetical protein D3C86_2026350 [compost metagenome]
MELITVLGDISCPFVFYARFAVEGGKCGIIGVGEIDDPSGCLRKHRSREAACRHRRYTGHGALEQQAS